MNAYVDARIPTELRSIDIRLRSLPEGVPFSGNFCAKFLGLSFDDFAAIVAASLKPKRDYERHGESLVITDLRALMLAADLIDTPTCAAIRRLVSERNALVRQFIADVQG